MSLRWNMPMPTILSPMGQRLTWHVSVMLWQITNNMRRVWSIPIPSVIWKLLPCALLTSRKNNARHWNCLIPITRICTMFYSNRWAKANT